MELVTEFINNLIQQGCIIDKPYRKNGSEYQIQFICHDIIFWTVIQRDRVYINIPKCFTVNNKNESICYKICNTLNSTLFRLKAAINDNQIWLTYEYDIISDINKNVLYVKQLTAIRNLVAAYETLGRLIKNVKESENCNSKEQSVLNLYR